MSAVISKLTPIKDRLPDYIEYNQIRVVIAGLVQKYGQVMSPTGDLVLDAPSSQVKNRYLKGDSSASA